MEINIDTVVEGAYPDTPQTIDVIGIELQVPENVKVLRVGDREKYILHGTTQDFIRFDVKQSPIFVGTRWSYNGRQKIPGGWNLKEHFPNIIWIYDGLRSVSTRDGRLYIEALYVHEDWRWSLDRVPEILDKAKKIFDAQNNEVER